MSEKAFDRNIFVLFCFFSFILQYLYLNELIVRRKSKQSANIICFKNFPDSKISETILKMAMRADECDIGFLYVKFDKFFVKNGFSTEMHFTLNNRFVGNDLSIHYITPLPKLSIIS